MMLVKFFKRGSSKNGRGLDVLNYLAGENFKYNTQDMRDGARVLRGNPFHTTELIDQSPYKKKYLSGCLSFHADEQIDDKTKQALIDKFEQCLLPGMTADQYSSYWIEHADKIDEASGKHRLELNFVFASTELTHGRFLNVYYHYSDVKRVDLWQSLVNYDYNLLDPKDPIRLANSTISKTGRISDKQRSKKQEIYDQVEGGVNQGEIVDRKSLLKFLEKEGYEFSRIAKTSISVKVEGGQNIRLKGQYFDENFDAEKHVLTPCKERSRQWQIERQQQIGSMRAEFDNLLKKRKQDLQKRHAQPKKLQKSEVLAADSHLCDQNNSSLYNDHQPNNQNSLSNSFNRDVYENHLQRLSEFSEAINQLFPDSLNEESPQQPTLPTPFHYEMQSVTQFDDPKRKPRFNFKFDNRTSSTELSFFKKKEKEDEALRLTRSRAAYTEWLYAIIRAIIKLIKRFLQVIADTERERINASYRTIRPTIGECEKAVNERQQVIEQFHQHSADTANDNRQPATTDQSVTGANKDTAKSSEFIEPKPGADAANDEKGRIVNPNFEPVSSISNWFSEANTSLTLASSRFERFIEQLKVRPEMTFADIGQLQVEVEKVNNDLISDEPKINQETKEEKGNEVAKATKPHKLRRNAP